MTIEVKSDLSKALVDAEGLVRCHIREKFHIYSVIMAAPLAAAGQMIDNIIQRLDVPSIMQYRYVRNAAAFPAIFVTSLPHAIHLPS